MDVSNGSGIGISLFVQGCHFHCKGCFNQETWDFDGGEEFTDKVEQDFYKFSDESYVTRISILGGEPLADENVSTVLRIIKMLKLRHPDKKIWVFTGYTYEDIMCGKNQDRIDAVRSIDVLADGRFQLDNQDINHKKVLWVGSTNQRVIDVPKTITEGNVVTL